MEAASFLETLISIYQFTCLYIPTDSNLHHHYCGNLKSHTEITVFQDVTPCIEHSRIMSLITEAVAGVTSQMQPASMRK